MYEDGQLAHLCYDLIFFFLHFFSFFVLLYIINDKTCLSWGPFRKCQNKKPNKDQNKIKKYIIM